MFELVTKLFGNPNDRKIRRLLPIVDHINDLEAEYQRLSDEDLVRKTWTFRQELDNREQGDTPERDRQLEQAMLDLLLPEAFAVVREAGRRVLNMRHFDVQLVGGMVLHGGSIAEMRTGEGKTLVATLPAYLNALTGKGVHVVTVNDYLARRDAEWMGQLFQFLGLSVGMVLAGGGMAPFSQKRAAYQADITYGTNNEFGFDYLRDNMAKSMDQLVQRPFHYAIVDEVDSILIDEARTPLIISGRLEQSAETYQSMAQLAPHLKRDDDYTVDEKARNVILTEEGIDHAQQLLGVSDLFDPKTNLAHHLLQALKAKELFRRDVEYVVKDNEVVIVDEFTGRLMDGRRWSDGLHQSVEAKEGVRIQDETQTLASITFQNLFRLYPKLSGMTGTALTEEAEFGKIYNLEVTAIPTNRSDVRKDLPDLVFKSETVKSYKAVEEIVECHQQGRPVLVGTVSIEKSEWLSHLLTDPTRMIQHLRDKAARALKTIQETQTAKEAQLVSSLSMVLGQPEAVPQAEWERLQAACKDQKAPEWAELLENIIPTVRAVAAIRQGLPHQVLNAKHHEREAMIVAQAGRSGAITIATNMAGRGTDILLGGNADILTKEQFFNEGRDYHDVPKDEYQARLAQNKALTDADHERVVAAGGLHVIGTERHESRRIDNQLRGRAARQGDPGTTRFYLSLEDNLMRLFGGQRIAGLMEMMNVDETLPITHGLVNRAIESAQRKVEAYHFDMRKHVLQYDDVLTEQRKLIYAQRRKVLEGYNLRASMQHMVAQEMGRVVSAHLTPEGSPEDWDPETVRLMLETLHSLSPHLAHLDEAAIQGLGYNELIERFQAEGLKVYEALEAECAAVYEQFSAPDADGQPVVAPASDAPEHPLRDVEREILLSVIDTQWVDFLHNLDLLREGIGLRAYGQKDPLIEYKREAFDLFQSLSYDIQHEAVTLLLRARMAPPEEFTLVLDPANFGLAPEGSPDGEAGAATSPESVADLLRHLGVSEVDIQTVLAGGLPAEADPTLSRNEDQSPEA